MAEAQDDFFVGYLRTPLRIARFVAMVAVVLLLGADVVAVVLYRAGAAWTSGEWGSVGEAAYDGILVTRPYPVVLVPATVKAPAHAVLLVSADKVGAPPGLGALDGKPVTVQGYPLFRDGITVLQLDAPPRASKAALAPLVPAQGAGTTTVSGEIVDTKCFLGAMVPGEGKVHAACAGLCLLGDIPALFVTREADGHLTYRLLADEHGGAMADAAASRAGQNLNLTGTLTKLDGIEVLSVPRSALD